MHASLGACSRLGGMQLVVTLLTCQFRTVGDMKVLEAFGSVGACSTCCSAEGTPYLKDWLLASFTEQGGVG